MSAISDKARDFWDRISPRERRLVVIAAIALPVTLAIWLGLSIRDGLIDMEKRNQTTRKALDVMQSLRARGETHQRGDDVLDTMGTEPLKLETYLDNAAKKAAFTLKSSTPSQPDKRNGFVTNSVTCSLDDLTIEQLKTFLMEIETGSKYVAVTHIDLRRDFRDKAKLDVTLEVSTYSKEPKATEGGAPDAAAGSAKKGT